MNPEADSNFFRDEPYGDFFGQFFGDIPDREMKQRSLGSGFIVDKEGYIITNNHVVSGADEIKVKLADGREYTAKVVGRDSKTDLALINPTQSERQSYPWMVRRIYPDGDP